MSHSCGGTGAWEDHGQWGCCLHPCRPTWPSLHPWGEDPAFLITETEQREREAVTPLRRDRILNAALIVCPHPAKKERRPGQGWMGATATHILIS